MSEDDLSFGEECGVFAAFNMLGASSKCLMGLHALQHRGQEAGGIVSSNLGILHEVKAKGELRDVFKGIDLATSLPGDIAIGHVRYATSGGIENHKNVQPLIGMVDGKPIVLVHNGNLINLTKVCEDLVKNHNVEFTTSMDTEVFLHLLIHSKESDIIARIQDAVSKVEGAYSIIILYENSLIAFRDAFGVRPLIIGKLNFTDQQLLGDESVSSLNCSYLISSESCALDIVDADFYCNVETGKIAVINDSGLTIFDALPKKAERFCVFEYIYFHRPDSIRNSTHVYDIRKNLGKILAKEHPVEADVVIAVPDSGVPAALGFAGQSGIPFEFGITRNHYVGRTFIMSTNEIRRNSLGMKHNANKSVVAGKRVVIVDDSIVRGNTLQRIVSMIKKSGAKEIHLRIASPEMKYSCYYGVDTPDRAGLISNRFTVPELRDFFGADTLGFISQDGLYEAVCNEERNNLSPQFCDACLTGDYFIAKDYIDAKIEAEEKCP